ncbi:hypothetical protein ACTMU2_23555 [Cupriavidus basilensis]
MYIVTTAARISHSVLVSEARERQRGALELGLHRDRQAQFLFHLGDLARPRRPSGFARRQVERDGGGRELRPGG